MKFPQNVLHYIWHSYIQGNPCKVCNPYRGFLCHRSTPLEFTPPWYPKLIFSTNIPFQTQNTSLQNCVPSLGSFPSPWTVYPDFDSCYSHFMPYRMTPSVRHMAIEVHYYYYYIKSLSRYFQLTRNRVHQNVSLHISFLIFYGSLIGCIILLPQEVVLWLVTKILFPAEVVLCSQSEYQRIRKNLSFWWTSLNG